MARKNTRKYMLVPIELDGVRHEIEVKRKGHRFVVNVDGQPRTMLQSGTDGFWFGVYQDFVIDVDGKPVTLAVRGSSMRFAIEGKYLDNGSEHLPPPPFPSWLWGFAGLNILMMAFAIKASVNKSAGIYWYNPNMRALNAAIDGGMAGALGMCAFMLSLYLARDGLLPGRKPLSGTGPKVIGCFVVTILFWLLWLGWDYAFYY